MSAPDFGYVRSLGSLGRLLKRLIWRRWIGFSQNGLNRCFTHHRNWGHVVDRGGYVQWHRLAHNYPWILPNDQFFESNPEYYALYKGRRWELGDESANVCTTNPEVIEKFANYIAGWFDQHVDATGFPISPPDGMTRWCECMDCQSLGGINFVPNEKGSMTRRQVTFVNAVAEKVAQTSPGKQIILLPYQNYLEPPVDEMRLEPNVVVQVARRGDFAHGLDSSGNAAALARLEGVECHRGARSRELQGCGDYALLMELEDGKTPPPLATASALHQLLQQQHAIGGRHYFTQATDIQQHNPVSLLCRCSNSSRSFFRIRCSA